VPVVKELYVAHIHTGKDIKLIPTASNRSRVPSPTVEGNRLWRRLDGGEFERLKSFEFTLEAMP